MAWLRQGQLCWPGSRAGEGPQRPWSQSPPASAGRRHCSGWRRPQPGLRRKQQGSPHTSLQQHNGPCLSRGGRGGPCLRQNAALTSDFWIKRAAMPPFHLRALHSGSEWIFRALLLIHKSQNASTPEHISHVAVIYNPDGAEINPEFRLNMVKTAFCCT